MKTTLLIMAAGIGSRFGTGIKQLEPVDDAGHIIMDYKNRLEYYRQKDNENRYIICPQVLKNKLDTFLEKSKKRFLYLAGTYKSGITASVIKYFEEKDYGKTPQIFDFYNKEMTEIKTCMALKAALWSQQYVIIHIGLQTFPLSQMNFWGDGKVILIAHTPCENLYLKNMDYVVFNDLVNQKKCTEELLKTYVPELLYGNRDCQDILISRINEKTGGIPLAVYRLGNAIFEKELLRYEGNLEKFFALPLYLNPELESVYEDMWKDFIQYMDKCGYSFVIMVKGMSALVNELILENKGTFENKRVNNIYEYGVYGKTIRHKLYASDKKERYFHLYHSISKESAERIEIENRINQMTQYLKKYQNKVKEFGPGFEKYFNLYYDEKSQAFILPEERCSVVERELDLAGYFCIVTSEKMSAKEAIELYKSRDVSEKLFRGDKSYLGNKSIRVYSEESARAKIFVEFVAMIVRCKMYIKLKEEMKKLDKKLNYMTVPAAIKELEKIEMVRQLDNIYRLDHAVTANQKVILKAFGLDANSIKYFASELSKELREAE